MSVIRGSLRFLLASSVRGQSPQCRLFADGAGVWWGDHPYRGKECPQLVVMFWRKFMPSGVKHGDREGKGNIFSLQKYKESAGFHVWVLTDKASSGP